MSEPVKSVEIEDVLSSIRRLVSENHRQPTQQPSEAGKTAPDRLVLTDALRVMDPQPDPEETAQDDASDPLVLEAPEPADTQDDTADADHHDAHDQGYSAQDDHDGHDHADADASHDDDHHDDHDHQDEPEPDMHHDDAPSHDEAQSGDAQNADTAEASDHAHDDGHDDEPATQSAQQSEGASDDAPWSDPNTTLYAAAGLTDADEADDMRPLGEKIAALEEVIGRTDDQWEPDDLGVDEYAGTQVETLEWEDTDPEPAEQAYTQETAREPQPAEDPDTGVFDEDLTAEALLDEAALRDLVADIVREELQGVLGERITRNVRKLVRREIHRALAVRELE